MQDAFDITVQYVHERKQFNKAVGTFQLMQGPLDILFTLLRASTNLHLISGKIAG